MCLSSPNLGGVLAKLDAFCSRVLGSKYYKGCFDFDMFSSKADASNAWQGFISSVDVL